MRIPFLTLVPVFLALGIEAASAEAKVTVLHSMETHDGHQLRSWATPVAHFKGQTYYVSPDSDDRPVVAHVDPDGKTETVFLDPQPDYLAFPDAHNSFSLGIDEEGYVHVTGDMHQFGAAHSRDGRYPYPERYDDKKDVRMLYWRSAKPWDLSAGFGFRGGSGSAHLLPGISWSYGRFFNDADGKLFYSARVRAFTATSYQVLDARRGSMGIGLYGYDSSSETWAAIGAPPDHPNPAIVGKSSDVIFWANSGRMDTGQAYQVYMANFNFDTKGRLHAAISATIGKDNLARILYAYSDDRGQTWHKSDGSSIPGLPLRGEDGQPNLAEEVATMNRTGIVAVVADRKGQPAIKYGTDGTSGWYVRKEDSWICKPTRPDGIPGNRAFIMPDADLVFTAPWIVAKVPDLSPENFPGKSRADGFSAVSQLGALTTGSIYGLRMSKGKGKKIKLTLAEMAFTPDESGTGR